jgi:hypothetical protein
MGYAGACPVTPHGCRGEMRRALRRPARTGGLSKARRTSAGADGPPLGRAREGSLRRLALRPSGGVNVLGTACPLGRAIPESGSPAAHHGREGIDLAVCWRRPVALSKEQTGETQVDELRPAIGDLSPRGEKSQPLRLPLAATCGASDGSGELRLRRLRRGGRCVNLAAPGCGGAPAPSP